MDNAAKNGFFLRSIVFAIICTFAFFVPLSSALAATDNQTSGETMMPQVTAEDLKVEGKLTGGSTVPFGFTLNNVENRGFFDIGYRVYVLDSNKDIYFQKDFPKLYILAPFEKRNIDSSFDLPKAIPAGDYVLHVEAISPSGAGLGDIQAEVKISGSGVSAVTFGNVSISSGEMKSPIAKGIAVNPGDDIVASITVISKKDLNLKEQYKIYPDENFSEGLPVEDGQRLVKSGSGKYDFVVKSPENGGNFTMAYWLVDGDGQQVSPIKKFGWGIWGNLPGLNYISVDKTSAKKGENVDVEVALIPPVAKENIGEVTVKVWVGESYAEKKLDFSKTAVVLVPVLLKGNVNKPVIRVLAEKDGKTILDYKTSSNSALLKNNQTETVGVPKSNNMLYLGLGMFFVVALVLVFFFVKNRKHTVKVAVFLLFGFTFIFLAHKDSFASTSSDTRWTSVASVSCGPPGGYYYITNFFIYKNGSLTAAAQDTLFRPGDTIRFEGRVHSTASCSLRGNGSVALSIGSTDLGAASDSLWDETYTIPATLDNIGNKSTRAVATWDGPVFNNGVVGSISTTYDMVIKMGPQAVDAVSLGVGSLPTCADSSYNATFNFTGRALAENYDINWATDSAFTANYGSVTTGLSGAGAKSFTTTTAPFAVGSTYYWRVNARNSNAGSDVTTVATSTMGPVAACPPGAPTGLIVTNPLPCALSTTAPNNYIGGSDADKKVTFGWTAATGAVTSYEIRVTGPVATNLDDPSGGWAFATVPSGTLSVDSSGNPPSTNPPKWGSSPVTSFTYKNSTKQVVETKLVGTTNLSGIPANGFGGSQYGEIHLPLSSVAGSTYNFMVIAKNGSVASASAKFAFTVNQCPPPANPSGLTVTPSCNGSSPEVLFSFTDNSNNEDRFWLDVNGAAWTGPSDPSPWGVKTITTADKSGVGSTVNYLWNASDQLSGTPTLPAGGTQYYWRVKANNAVGDSAHVYPPNTTTAPGTVFTTLDCTPLGVATGLIVTNPLPCAQSTTAPNNYIGGSDPTKKVTFGWTAATGTVTSYEVRVTNVTATNMDDPSGGWATTSVGGDNTSVDSSSGATGVDQPRWLSSPVVGMTNKNSIKQLVETNLVGATSIDGSQVNGFGGSQWGEIHLKTGSTGPITYNFMVIAKNGSGSTASAKSSFTVNQCPTQSDLMAEFVDGTWENERGYFVHPGMIFQPGETVKVNVKVTNLNPSGSDSPASELYVYYSLAGLTTCPTAAAGAPPDAGGTPRGYTIPAIPSTATTPELASYTTISVTFKIGTAGSTANAVADPKCLIDAAPWANNVDSQTYIVQSNGFFETQGGDVGAALGAVAKQIRVSFDSSTITPPGQKYQSDYVVAGNIEPNVHSAKPWELNNYAAKQVPIVGVYEYFKNKFPQPTPAVSSCDFEELKPVSYCNNDFTFDTSKTPPTWDSVIFVNNDLNIQRDLIIPSDVTLVFIVGGDITVSLGVTEMHGIFITKGSFFDSHLQASDSGVDSAGFLTVKGALYVDALGGALNLRRYFTTPDNALKPSVKIIFEPKYLAKESVRNMIGVKSIVWKEVAP